MESRRSSANPRSQLYGQVRIGTVSSVDKQKHTVAVQLDEIDGLILPDLQMLVTRPGDYSLPAENTTVLCLIMDGALNVGYVLGAIYTDNAQPPLDDAGKRSIVGDDLRLGAADADEKVALASVCKQNFDAIWTVLNSVFGSSSSPLTLAPSGPDAVYTAMKAAVAAQQAANKMPFADPAADKVSVPKPSGGG